MNAFNAFVTPEYPVLFTLRLLDGGEPWKGAVPPPEGLGSDPVPSDGRVAISLALIIKGMPSFLATHVVPAEEAGDVVESLESGDARVAVVGITITVEEGGESGSRPAAFVSLLCGDGRRLAVARILGPKEGRTPEELAKYVIKQISQGVQVPDLASAR